MIYSLKDYALSDSDLCLMYSKFGGLLNGTDDELFCEMSQVYIDQIERSQFKIQYLKRFLAFCDSCEDHSTAELMSQCIRTFLILNEDQFKKNQLEG